MDGFPFDDFGDNSVHTQIQIQIQIQVQVQVQIQISTQAYLSLTHPGG